MPTVQAFVNIIPVLIDWIVRLLALATPVALWYRFVWGAKSQISVRQLPDLDNQAWSYVRIDDEEMFANYIHVVAINRGWWTGFIWGITLREVTFDDDHTVRDASDDTVKIEIDAYSEGETKRLARSNPHPRVERSIPGRDIRHLKIVPFLRQNSELARWAEKSETAEFEFVVRIQDNQRTDLVPVTVTKDVSDVSFDD